MDWVPALTNVVLGFIIILLTLSVIGLMWWLLKKGILSLLWKFSRVLVKLALRKIRRSPLWKWVGKSPKPRPARKPNRHMLNKWLVVSVVMATAIVLMVTPLFNQIGGVNWKLIGGWILGLTLLVVAITLLVRFTKKSGGTTTSKFSWKWILWPIATLVTLVLIVTLAKWWVTPSYTSGPSTIVVMPGADYHEFKTVTIDPGVPLVVAVAPGYQVDFWRDTKLTGLDVNRRGSDLISTVSAAGEHSSELTFRLFRCNAATDCK